MFVCTLNDRARPDRGLRRPLCNSLENEGFHFCILTWFNIITCFVKLHHHRFWAFFLNEVVLSARLLIPPPQPGGLEQQVALITFGNYNKISG